MKLDRSQISGFNIYSAGARPMAYGQRLGVEQLHHCKTQSFFFKENSFKHLKIWGSCQFEGLWKVFLLQTCVGTAMQIALKGKKNLQFDGFHKPLLNPSNKALGICSALARHG